MNIIKPRWPAPDKVQACITTRQEGESRPPYDQFNLGARVGDNTEAVDANRDSLYREIGQRVTWLEQVHGTEILSLPLDLARPTKKLMELLQINQGRCVRYWPLTVCRY